MTEPEHEALDRLLDRIRRERLQAECPCARALLAVLSDGLAELNRADEQTRPAA